MRAGSPIRIAESPTSSCLQPMYQAALLMRSLLLRIATIAREHRARRGFACVDGRDRVVRLLDQRRDQPAQERVARPGGIGDRNLLGRNRVRSSRDRDLRAFRAPRLDDDAARPARAGLGQRRLDERPLAAAVHDQVSAPGQVASQIGREGVWVALNRPDQLLVRLEMRERRAAGGLRLGAQANPVGRMITSSCAGSSVTPRELPASYRQ